MLRYHGRCVGSGTTESVRATRGSTTQDGTDAVHGCCAMLFLFLMARYRTAVRACCDHKSREYALSLCGVTLCGPLCAPRASFPRTYHHNQRVVCFRLSRQRVKYQLKEKLGLEQLSAQQTFVAKVTVCRHVVSNRHSFPVLTMPCTQPRLSSTC